MRILGSKAGMEVVTPQTELQHPCPSLSSSARPVSGRAGLEVPGVCRAGSGDQKGNDCESEDLRACSHQETSPRLRPPHFPIPLPAGPEAGRDRAAGPPSQQRLSCGDRGERVRNSGSDARR